MSEPFSMNRFVEFCREVVRADESYFRMVLRQMDRQQVPGLVRNYMQMRETMFAMVETLTRPAEPVTPPINMTFTLPTGWNDPVPVVATQAEIQNSMINLAASDPPQVCAVCQDSIHSFGVQLRNCHHNFHRSCILTWFSTSPRCPVCRNDIREEVED